MKTTAGTGLTDLTRQDAVIQMFQAFGSSTASMTVSLTLPEGRWWRIRSVVAFVDVATPGVNAMVLLQAIKGAQNLFAISQITDLPGINFAGQVTWGINLPYAIGTVDTFATCPLPDTLVPGGTVINLIPAGTGAQAFIQFVNMIAEGTVEAA